MRFCISQAGGGRLRRRPFSKHPWVIIWSNVLLPCRRAPVFLTGGERACTYFTSGWEESLQANSLVYVQFTWGNNVSSLFLSPECFKIFLVDFVSEIWARKRNMSHDCCIGKFHTKGVIQCFLMAQRRQRRFIVWAAYWWFELFIQTTLCQLFVFRKRKVTSWRLCLPGIDTFKDGIFLLCFGWEVLDA